VIGGTDCSISKAGSNQRPTCTHKQFPSSAGLAKAPASYGRSWDLTDTNLSEGVISLAWRKVLALPSPNMASTGSQPVSFDRLVRAGKLAAQGGEAAQRQPRGCASGQSKGLLPSGQRTARHEMRA